MASESAPPPSLTNRCVGYSPQTKCASRREAQSIGEFFYSFHHRGWVLGEDRMVSKVMRDEHKVTYTWTFCPWCGGALPDLVSAVEKGVWVDPDPIKRNADGSEGDE